MGSTKMKGFITDENNDLTLDKWGDIKMDDGIEVYRQHIVNELRLQQYEYPYNPNKGINYLGYVLGQTGNLTAWETQLLDLINALPFVTRVVDWKANVINNNLAFELIVNTDLGEIQIKG